MLDIAEITSLFQSHQWLPIMALVLGAIVRLLKSDNKFPISIPAEWRPTVAACLGLVAGAVDLVLAGSTWQHALVTAIGAPLIATIGHVVGIEMIRGGKEIPIPGLMKYSGKVGPGSVISLIAILMTVCGCASLPKLPDIPKGSPPLTVLQAIAGSAVEIVKWCEDRGITPDKVAAAKKAIEEHDYQTGLALLSEAVAASRAAGEPIPEEVERTLRLAEGAAAAQAIENFARAMSTPSVRDAGTPPSE